MVQVLIIGSDGGDCNGNKSPKTSLKCIPKLLPIMLFISPLCSYSNMNK